MKYWTIVHFDHSRSKEGVQRYTRVDGKILLFRSRNAASAYREARGWRRMHNQLVTDVEVIKLRKDHQLMEVAC